MTPTTLELSWLRPQAEVDRFVVSYVSAGNQRVRLEVPSEADGTVLTDLMPGVEYVVTVTAERGRAVSYPASVRANTGMAGQGLGKGPVSLCSSPFLSSPCLGFTGSSECALAGCVVKHLLGPCCVTAALGRPNPRGLESLGKAAGWTTEGVAPWREAVNRRGCLTHPDGKVLETALGQPCAHNRWSALVGTGIRQIRDPHSRWL